MRAFRRIFYFLLILLLFFGELKYINLYSFSGRGPYLHSTITIEAIKRLYHNKNYEMSFVCGSLLAYLSAENDYNLSLAQDSSYHCDSNNIIGCSYRLNQLVEKASITPERISAIRYLGLALHIVQDFYSHSNWVEIFNYSYVLANIESFQKIPPPNFIQTGYFPDVFLEKPEATYECYFKDKNEIKGFIFGATHDCLNKDSNFTKRGMTLAEYSNQTLHELAAEYAIRHSKNLIEKVIKKNIIFKTCIDPKNVGTGCNTFFLNIINNNQKEIFKG